MLDSRAVAQLLGVSTKVARRALRARLGPGLRGVGAERWPAADVAMAFGFKLPARAQDEWQ